MGCARPLWAADPQRNRSILSKTDALPLRAEDNPGALAKALPEASVSLDRGLKASEREGKPISGKYELEDGALQLSVYTMKGDQFSEVIVDHKTGAIKKAEKITDPDDLKNAKEQSEAMANAKLSLEQVVEGLLARAKELMNLCLTSLVGASASSLARDRSPEEG